MVILGDPTPSLWPNGLTPVAVEQTRSHVTHWGPITGYSVHVCFGWVPLYSLCHECRWAYGRMLCTVFIGVFVSGCRKVNKNRWCIGRYTRDLIQPFKERKLKWIVVYFFQGLLIVAHLRIDSKWEHLLTKRENLFTFHFHLFQARCLNSNDIESPPLNSAARKPWI